MEKAIELRGVTKRFGSQVAVNQLDLKVPRGSIYGFIGPNGSGKTTTLRMILRIFQPDSGEVIVLGRGSGQVADDRLGYLPEERGLYKRMRVRELLTYYSRLKGHYDCQGDIDDWLKFLQADGWANRKIEALSKGMAQKVQFIAAVVARPELVILDEPFSGLDPVSAFTAVVACVNNIGPGLGEVGPATNFSGLTDFQTWVCTLAMLLGRLELLSVLVLLTPSFWRR